MRDKDAFACVTSRWGFLCVRGTTTCAPTSNLISVSRSSELSSLSLTQQHLEDGAGLMTATASLPASAQALHGLLGPMRRRQVPVLTAGGSSPHVRATRVAQGC
jgi:hypothetical protein